MFRLIVVICFLSSTVLCGQDQICLVNPEFTVKKSETHINDEGFGVMISNSSSDETQINLIKRADLDYKFKCEYCSFEFKGMSSDQNSIFVYLYGQYGTENIKKNYFLKMDRNATAPPFIGEFKPTYLEKNEKVIMTFSDSCFNTNLCYSKSKNSYKLVRMRKPDDFTVEEFSLATKDSKKNSGKPFEYDINKLKLFGDKIDFLVSDLDSRKAYLSKKGLVFQGDKKDSLRIVLFTNGQKQYYDFGMSKTADLVSSFFVNDLIFIAEKFDEMIVLKAIEMRNNKVAGTVFLNTSEGKFEFKKTPYLDIEGDTLDAKWKLEKVNQKILKDFKDNFYLGVVHQPNGSYIVTFANQPVATSAAPTGAPGGGMMLQSRETENYRFFRGCLTSDLKICNEPIIETPYTKALLRKKQLDIKRAFISFDKSACYLTYYDKSKKKVLVEQFK